MVFWVAYIKFQFDYFYRIVSKFSLTLIIKYTKILHPFSCIKNELSLLKLEIPQPIWHYTLDGYDHVPRQWQELFPIDRNPGITVYILRQ